MTENDKSKTGLDDATADLIYDAYALIQENSKLLSDLVNEHGGKEHKRAYKSGIYAPAISLQMILGSEAMDRGKARHEKIRKDLEEFFKRRRMREELVKGLSSGEAKVLLAMSSGSGYSLQGPDGELYKKLGRKGLVEWTRGIPVTITDEGLRIQKLLEGGER